MTPWRNRPHLPLPAQFQPHPQGRQLNDPAGDARLPARQIDEGLLPQAEAILRQILQQQPQHPGALHLMGVLAHRAGKTSLAVKFIGKAIEIQPHVAQFHANRGEMCRILNRLDQAIHHGELAVTLMPGDAIHHSKPAVSPTSIKRTTHVQSSASGKPCNCSRTWFRALNNLGCIRSQLKDKDGAIAYFSKVLEVAPNHYQAMHNLSFIYMEQGRLAEAEASSRRALEMKPDYAEAYSNLLFTLSHDPKVSIAGAVQRPIRSSSNTLASHTAQAGCLIPITVMRNVA